MKYVFVFLLLLLYHYSRAQFSNDKNVSYNYNDSEKYFSFNPLGVVEPYIALGLGYGNRFSKRSEYFTELSYLSQSPFNHDIVNSLRGFRFTGQYRYHIFSKQRKPIIKLLPGSKKRGKSSPFIGLEIRVKGYSFTNRNLFVNEITNDTLQNFLYKANAQIFGAAVIVGETYTISAKEKWKIDVVFGLGGKHKIVSFKNVPENYKIQSLETKEPAILPPIYKTAGSPSISFAVRLQYVFN